MIMRKGQLIMLMASSLLASSLSIAQAPDKPSFPPVNWTSKDQNDLVKIENGSNTAINVVITVDKVGSTNSKTGESNSSGVNIINCGDVTHIDAGSSAMCASNDPKNPVSFKSDSASSAATGTYQIKQQ